MNIKNHLICLSCASFPLKRCGIVVINSTKTKGGAAEKIGKTGSHEKQLDSFSRSDKHV